MLHILTTLVVLAFHGPHVSTQVPPSETVGTVYEITRSYRTEATRNDGGSSSSNGRDSFIERVIAVSSDGVEVEFDLGRTATAEDRARQWQLPARVLKPADGPLRLLNADELQARLTTWLNAAELSSEACGHWIFTWNAFKIECDPLSVLPMAEAFNLKGDPGVIAETPIDPNAVRRQRAESDIVVAEVTGAEPPTLEAAIQARANETVTGDVRTTLEADEQGRIVKRTQVTTMEIVEADGTSQRSTSTETIDRRPSQRVSN